MADRKHRIDVTEIDVTDAALAYASDLVDRGEYPNVGAAISGELQRARSSREQQAAVLEAEVERRLDLPLDDWEAVEDDADFVSPGHDRLAELRAAADQRRG
jgi:Arc/MetJ-type ribon-helix-helix transcriptional regulator